MVYANKLPDPQQSTMEKSTKIHGSFTDNQKLIFPIHAVMKMKDKNKHKAISTSPNLFHFIITINTSIINTMFKLCFLYNFKKTLDLPKLGFSAGSFYQNRNSQKPMGTRRPHFYLIWGGNRNPVQIKGNVGFSMESKRQSKKYSKNNTRRR